MLLSRRVWRACGAHAASNGGASEGRYFCAGKARILVLVKQVKHLRMLRARVEGCYSSFAHFCASMHIFVLVKQVKHQGFPSISLCLSLLVALGRPVGMRELEEQVWGIGEGGWPAHSPANCWERV